MEIKTSTFEHRSTGFTGLPVPSWPNPKDILIFRVWSPRFTAEPYLIAGRGISLCTKGYSQNADQLKVQLSGKIFFYAYLTI